MKKVVITTDYLKPGGEAETLLQQAGLEVEFSAESQRSGQDLHLRDQIGSADAIILGTEQLTREDMEKIVGLQIVARTGVGTDNIDLIAAKDLGIRVTNTPGTNAIAVAEYAIGLMLSAARKISAGEASVRSHKWQRFSGIELHGKTLGILGFGRIGSRVAQIAQSFGMEVLAYDPAVNEAGFSAAQVRGVSLDALLMRSDFISVHLPLTATTRNLLDAAAIQKMKPTAYLINSARGGILDEDALVQALQENLLGGAALDVFASEPIATNSPLKSVPNLVLTPHMGGATHEARAMSERVAATSIAAHFSGEEITNAVC